MGGTYGRAPESVFSNRAQLIWVDAPHAGGEALACALLCALALAGCGGGDELVTIDRVGRADAPKTLKVQINASYSPQASTPSIAKGFRKLFVEWAKKHPEWRLDLNIIGGNMTTTEQARLLEKAKVGTAPDCANVDSFTIPLFIEQGVLQPLDKYFTTRSCATCSRTCAR